MAGWNGFGVYDLRYNFVQDAANGIKILAARQDQMWGDMKTGFQNCMTCDGQTAATQHQNLGGKKVVGMAAGSSDTDAANISQTTYPGVAAGYVGLANMTSAVVETLFSASGTVTTLVDPLSAFNAATGLITCQKTGKYHVSVDVNFSLVTNVTWIQAFTGPSIQVVKNALAITTLPLVRNTSAPTGVSGFPVHVHVDGVVSLVPADTLLVKALSSFSAGSIIVQAASLTMIRVSG